MEDILYSTSKVLLESIIRSNLAKDRRQNPNLDHILTKIFDGKYRISSSFRDYITFSVIMTFNKLFLLRRPPPLFSTSRTPYRIAMPPCCSSLREQIPGWRGEAIFEKIENADEKFWTSKDTGIRVDPPPCLVLFLYIKLFNQNIRSL